MSDKAIMALIDLGFASDSEEVKDTLRSKIVAILSTSTGQAEPSDEWFVSYRHPNNFSCRFRQSARLPIPKEAVEVELELPPEAVRQPLTELIAKWRHAAEHLGLQGLASLADCADELEAALTSPQAEAPVADNWEQYAMEGETAQAVIERHRGEQDALLTLLAKARRPPEPERPLPELVVTLNGKVLTDQKRGIREFLEQATRNEGDDDKPVAPPAGAGREKSE